MTEVLERWTLAQGGEITTEAGSKVAVAVMHDHQPAVLLQFTAVGGSITRFALREEAAHALRTLLSQKLGDDFSVSMPRTMYVDAQDWPRESK